MKTKEELKLNFKNGNKPTQEQFWQWMDSYWHKEEKITEDSLGFVEKVFPIIIDDILWGHSLSLSISKNIKKIRLAAFQFSSMSYQIVEVNFNEGLEEIGMYAFQTQAIKKVKTPSTLRIIDNGAFDSQANVTYGTDAMEEIILNEGLIKIGDYAFNCPRGTVKDLYIPSSVQLVGQYAFKIPSLETVSAPTGLDLSNAGIPTTATITYR